MNQYKMCSPALPTADKFGNVPIDVLFLRGPVERFLRAMQGCDGEVQVGVGPAVLAVSALSASVCGKNDFKSIKECSRDGL